MMTMTMLTMAMATTKPAADATAAATAAAAAGTDQTAIAVASMATELIKGKTPSEALAMSNEDLSAPLGALPPMKIHCAQLVEGALKNALTGEVAAPKVLAPTLSDSFQAPKSVKIKFT